MAELKPCPFCGGRAFVKNSGVYAAGFAYRVYCGNEDCKIEPKTHAYFQREQAIEAWNRRANDGQS